SRRSRLPMAAASVDAMAIVSVVVAMAAAAGSAGGALPAAKPAASTASMAAAPVVAMRIALVISDPLAGACCHLAPLNPSILLSRLAGAYDVLRANPIRLSALQHLLSPHGEDGRILVVAAIEIAVGGGKLRLCNIAQLAIGLREI